MTRICFAGLESGRPVIPLAFACGIGTAHTYLHRENAIGVLSARAASLWTATAMEEAEVIVYPHLYVDCDSTRAVAREAERIGIPCLFFEHSDDENPAMPSYGMVWRTALDASTRRLREFAMSGLSDDLLASVGSAVPLRRKQSVPMVGFCGNTSSLPGNLKDLLQLRLHALRGTLLRHRAFRTLRNARDLRTSFLLRDAYWGGAVRSRQGRLLVGDEASRARLRREFVRNVIDSDYTLCVRGAGNYSIRFYEVLSAGRIPLFLNSRCVLPFDDVIDWKAHCIWVEEDDLGRIGRIVADFHRGMDDEGFQRLQLANRKLWEEWLEASAFYERAIALALQSLRPVASSS